MSYAIPHLHTSGGSVGDSIVKIPELVKRAKEIGIKAIAVTNHGSLADMYDFYFECKKEGVKPLIGCEVYSTNDRLYKEKDSKRHHLLLIAKNNNGLKNLLTICADAELVGKYYKPRTDWNFLEESDTSDIIATTACVGSEVNQYILNDEDDKALSLIKRMNNIFDNFYLEVQPGEFEEQIKVNKFLVNASEQLNIPILADLWWTIRFFS